MLVEVENIKFYLNPQDEEFGSVHAQMIEDFQDESKLNYFKELLLNDPNSAFLTYNNFNFDEQKFEVR